LLLPACVSQTGAAEQQGHKSVTFVPLALLWWQDALVLFQFSV